MNTKSQNIPKAFESKEKELEIYKIWEECGYFKPENVKEYLSEKGYKINRPFVMTLPPPNANGDLHLGHTCGYSFHDAMARFNRMTAHPTLLIAGKDHAGIQTETVYTKKLKSEGIDKWNLGREEFNKRCYDFCINAANNAREQEKRIGLSADWDREFFTLDPRLTTIIYQTFFKMFKDGLVYRDKRIINQCPNCKTALADIDTVHKELPGIFAYIVYPFVDEEDKRKAKEKFGVEGIIVATTRPETMLGDTAVAVHPKDERYKEFIGHKLLLPIVNREIPIITDEGIDIETGTGALKVTPAHSPIDFEIAQKNNIRIINVINEEGKMTGDIPSEYIGMDTVSCSKALVTKLEELGLFVKLDRIKHDVAVCERCETPIQPIISNQWYVNTQPLAQKALEALKNGDVKVTPAGQQRALQFFFENIQPWCISRQLWWGHKIPVWYSGSKELYDWIQENQGKTYIDYEKETGKKAHGTGRIFAQVEKPIEDTDWRGDLRELKFEAETDVFDTWFSSGQWPFSTTMASNTFSEYYPTNIMVHGRDILFWWSARMLMLGLYITDKVPFNTIFLHGLINAPDGSKMSKSKGNTVSPIKLFDKYGVDSLRLWYYADALPGSNAPLREEKIKGNRFFINKIWNASRFVLMNIDDEEVSSIQDRLNNSINSDRVIEFNEYKNKILNHLSNNRFNLGAEDIREFFWHTYCDKWIEEIKEEIKDKEINSQERIELLSELVYLLRENLKIMHPFIPYITESVWQELVKYGLAQGVLMIQQI